MKKFRKNKALLRIACLFVTISFLSNAIFPGFARAQDLVLPPPTQFVHLSNSYSFPVLKGLKFDPNKPFNMQFVIDTADQKDVDQEEASRLIKYFFAGLAIPEKDTWVNMSSYEKDRIIPSNLAETDLGKDLLSLDYILKQVSVSLTYPESEIGKDFWAKTYAAVLNIAHTTNLPVNTFNKIWIMPDKAEVYEHGNFALVHEATLKTMLEEDYLALKNNISDIQKQKKNMKEELIEKINQASSNVMREFILPKINKDVNSGKNFATLRQIYYSLILGVWFKKKFKDSIYKYYINQGKIKGIDLNEKDAKDKIYNMYIEALKKGLYNYIKSDYDPGTRRNIKRQYFSGGFTAMNLASSAIVTPVPETTIFAPTNLTGPAKLVSIAGSPIGVGKQSIAGSPIEIYELPRNDLEELVNIARKNREDELIKSKVYDARNTDELLRILLSIDKDGYDMYYALNEYRRGKEAFLDWLAYLVSPVLRERREVRLMDEEINKYANSVYNLLTKTKADLGLADLTAGSPVKFQQILSIIDLNQLSEGIRLFTQHGAEFSPQEVAKINAKIEENYKGPIDVVGKLGGTSMAFEGVNADGFLGFRAIEKTIYRKDKKDSEEEVVARIVSSIAKAIDHYGVMRVRNVYFSAPGFFRPDGTLLEDESNMPEIKAGFSFEKTIAEKLNARYPNRGKLGLISVKVVHDATAGALGETSIFGSYPGLGNIFYVIAGTGIGTRLLVNGQPFYGDKEINYMHNEGPHHLLFNGDSKNPDYRYVALETKGRLLTTKFPNGEDLEYRTSGPAIAEYAKKVLINVIDHIEAQDAKVAKDALALLELSAEEKSGEFSKRNIANLTSEILGKAANSGNQLAKDIIQTRAKELGIGLAVLIMESHKQWGNTFSLPERIVIGSGVAQIGQIFLDAVKAGARQRFTAEYKYLADRMELSRIKDDTGRELLGGLPTQSEMNEFAKKMSGSPIQSRWLLNNPLIPKTGEKIEDVLRQFLNDPLTNEIHLAVDVPEHTVRFLQIASVDIPGIGQKNLYSNIKHKYDENVSIIYLVKTFGDSFSITPRQRKDSVMEIVAKRETTSLTGAGQAGRAGSPITTTKFTSRIYTDLFDIENGETLRFTNVPGLSSVVFTKESTPSKEKYYYFKAFKTGHAPFQGIDIYLRENNTAQVGLIGLNKLIDLDEQETNALIKTSAIRSFDEIGVVEFKLPLILLDRLFPDKKSRIVKMGLNEYTIAYVSEFSGSLGVTGKLENQQTGKPKAADSPVTAEDINRVTEWLVPIVSEGGQTVVIKYDGTMSLKGSGSLEARQIFSNTPHDVIVKVNQIAEDVTLQRGGDIPWVMEIKGGMPQEKINLVLSQATGQAESLMSAVAEKLVEKTAKLASFQGLSAGKTASFLLDSVKARNFILGLIKLSGLSAEQASDKLENINGLSSILSKFRLSQIDLDKTEIDKTDEALLEQSSIANLAKEYKETGGLEVSLIQSDNTIVSKSEKAIIEKHYAITRERMAEKDKKHSPVYDPEEDLNYRGEVGAYYNRVFLTDVAKKMEDFVDAHFTNKGKRLGFIVKFGIGANEEYDHHTRAVYETKKNDIVYAVMNNSYEFEEFRKRHPDANGENTLMIYESRSGETEEPLKVFLFNYKDFPVSIVFSNKGPLYDSAEGWIQRQKNKGNVPTILRLDFRTDMAGRYMRRKTPMSYCALHLLDEIVRKPEDRITNSDEVKKIKELMEEMKITKESSLINGIKAQIQIQEISLKNKYAGHWAYKYMLVTDEADKLLSFTKKGDSLAVQIAEFVHHNQMLARRTKGGRDQIALIVNDGQILWPATEQPIQNWMEGVNKPGNKMIMNRYLFTEEPYAIQGILDQADSHIAFFVLNKKLSSYQGAKMKAHEMQAKGIPVIMIEMDEPDIENTAGFSSLMEDFIVYYAGIIGQDPYTNPEVKYVRENSDSRLVVNGDEKRARLGQPVIPSQKKEEKALKPKEVNSKDASLVSFVAVLDQIAKVLGVDSGEVMRAFEDNLDGELVINALAEANGVHRQTAVDAVKKTSEFSKLINDYEKAMAKKEEMQKSAVDKSVFIEEDKAREQAKELGIEYIDFSLGPPDIMVDRGALEGLKKLYTSIRGEDSLAKKIAEFIHLSVSLLKKDGQRRENIVLTTNDQYRLNFAKAFKKFWAYNVSGLAKLIFDIDILPRASHLIIEGRLGQADSHFNIVVLSEELGLSKEQVLSKEDVEFSNPAHQGLDRNEALFGLAMGNKDTILAKMPGIYIRVKEIAPKTELMLAQLGKEISEHYAVILKTVSSSPATASSAVKLVEGVETVTISNKNIKPGIWGTAGYRGVKTDPNDFSLDNVRRQAAGFAEEVLERIYRKEYTPINGKTVRVAFAFDSRKDSDEYAYEMAKVLAAYEGFEVDILDEALPTPVVARLTQKKRPGAFDFAFHVTPSHNQLQYGGIKLLFEGSVNEHMWTYFFEKRANAKMEYPVNPNAQLKRAHVIDQLIEEYFQEVFPGLIEKFAAFKRLNPSAQFTVDLMDGSMVSFAHLFERLGIRVVRRGFMKNIDYSGRSYELADGKKVGFAPDPTQSAFYRDEPEYQEFKEKAPDGSIYFLIDGDGDRLVTIIKRDGKLNTLKPNQFGPLATDYILTNHLLPEVNQIVRTYVTTAGMDAVAKYHGFPDPIIVPVGSKYFNRFVPHAVALEESGHFVAGDFFDDTIYQIGLILSMMSDTNKDVFTLLAETQEKIGYKGMDKRDDFENLSPEVKAKFIESLTGTPEDVREKSQKAVKATVAQSGKELLEALVVVEGEHGVGRVVKLEEYVGSLFTDNPLVIEANNKGIIVRFKDLSWGGARLSGTGNTGRLYTEGRESHEERQKIANAFIKTLDLPKASSSIKVSSDSEIISDLDEGTETGEAISAGSAINTPGGIDMANINVDVAPGSSPINMSMINLENLQGFTFRIIKIEPILNLSSIFGPNQKAAEAVKPQEQLAYLKK